MDEHLAWEFGLNHKPYIPAASTDVMATWRRHGYTPPSEQPEYQDKWSYYRNLYLKGYEPEPEQKLAPQPWF